CDDEAAMVLESIGREAGDIRKKRACAFSRFSIEGKEERDPLSLSGGEKKRLLLAALEMQNPDLWILDETLDELDREGQEFLLTYLVSLAAEQQKGVILFASKYRDIFDSVRVRKALLRERHLHEEEDAGTFRDLLAGEGLIHTDRETLSSGKYAGEHPGDNTEPNDQVGVYELRDISFSYPGKGDFSLHLDSFSIKEGEIVVLAGPNGCGKSTLARILCGLLTPDKGEVLLKGSPAVKEELNRNGAYLFQNPDYQLFLPTVEEELALGLKHRGLKKSEQKGRIADAMDLFNLPSGEAPPALLSFGARKRLQGAIYYLLEKNLYILDEADSGLSFSDYGCIVRELMRKGTAMIIISHDPKVQQMAAHRVVEMKNGRIIGEKRL
ncbi:MAG: ATP-binding cassette domain-containing protein, partial [Spirochaetales bacterium]|nr:ATP-binding cassette domain-containing protein [Spirochaetales bacterium]